MCVHVVTKPHAHHSMLHNKILMGRFVEAIAIALLNSYSYIATYFTLSYTWLWVIRCREIS